MHPVVRGLVALPPHLKLLLVLPCCLFIASCLSSLVVIAFAVFGYNLRRRNSVRRRILLRTIGIEEYDDEHKHIVVGFFHPYWAIIFVPLASRSLVEDSTWPRFTLLGQSIGSIFLALEGLKKGVIPDVWLDTMGYAFAYPFVKSLCRVPVGSYTHYPTISTDMLKRVQSRQAGHTNTAVVARSTILSAVKIVYYVIFAELYSVCLRRADVLMVNSSWTRDHINHLLKPFGYRDDVENDVTQDAQNEVFAATSATASTEPGSATLRERRSTKPATSAAITTGSRFQKSRILYPPCDTTVLARLPIEVRENLILSVAQFRPEKEHEVQLKAFRKLLEGAPQYRHGAVRVELVLAGSVRNEEDEARVTKLRALAKDLSIEENVSFAVNVEYAELVKLFGRASIGLHTMVDEHFGITVVEFQAAGLVPLVHASAGPLLDIVVPYDGMPTGFHATNVQEFADKMRGILELDQHSLREMGRRARQNAVERFSTHEFEQGWLQAWKELHSKARID
ncbi:asparagine-linked glycosylation protein [Microbotryomycetes sp. JL201]|nr:asparagine-linked glycosylation protein [Microbotryomycetes sp. JL201]